MIAVTLLFFGFLVQQTGAAPSCNSKERLNSDGQCEPCPVCPVGQGYNMNQSCGYGEGQGVECSPCPEGTYSSDFSNPTCQTCVDCEGFYNQHFMYKCRPEINAVCGDCLPGFEKDPNDSEFLKVPCLPCSPLSTSEVCVAYRREMTNEQLVQIRMQLYPMLEKNLTETEAENSKLNRIITEEALAQNETIAELKKQLSAQEYKTTKWKAIAIVFIAMFIAEHCIGGVFVLFWCCFRYREKRPEKDKANGREGDETTVQLSAPLLQPGLTTEEHPRVGHRDSQRQKSHALGAQPVYSLEEDAGTTVTGNHSHPPNYDTDATGNADGADSSVSLEQTQVPCNTTNSAPSSGIYSMTPSQASTALVQPSRPAGAISLDENAATHTDLSSLPLSSLGGSRVPASTNSTIVKGPGALGMHERPFSLEIPQHQGPVPGAPVSLDMSQEHVSNGTASGATPQKGQRGAAIQSKVTKKDKEAFENAMVQAGDRRVCDLPQKFQDKLAAVMNNEKCQYAPTFHHTAETLKVPRDTFRVWNKADDLLRYCCSKHTSIVELLDALDVSSLIRARNILASYVLFDLDNNNNPGDNQGPHSGTPRSYSDNDNLNSFSSGNQRLDPGYRIPHSPAPGTMWQDHRNLESEVGDSRYSSLDLPSINQSELQDTDDEQGAVGGHEPPSPTAQESKGSDCYPVQCTGSLTPTGHEEFHPFVITQQNSRS